MSGCTHEWSKGELNCPYCEIDRLNKEINRLRQYEDAITSAIDGTLLVWNLISTDHTVIKNDYWQNHLEEIDRLKAELEYTKEMSNAFMDERNNLRIQLSEARAENEEYKAGIEVEGHVCMQELGASVPGLSSALLAYPHKVKVLVMKGE